MKQKGIEKKRQQEQETVSLMIGIYCRGNHRTNAGTKGMLCPECAALQQYASERTARCPFMETKTFCSSCKVHCYSPEMREKIRAVMRYAGPRMLFSHPAKAMAHAVETMKQKQASKVEKHKPKGCLEKVGSSNQASRIEKYKSNGCQ